jgi:HPt (histidine-containing phosphotransfer) domain-containing protein
MIGERTDEGVKLAMELIDLDTLRQLEEDTSREFLPQMVTLFCTETLDRVGKMRQAKQSGDFVALASEAHAITSGAGTFGARELQALARIVEQASHDGDYELALNKAAELEQVASLSLEMLTQYAGLGKGPT